jgi:hypothetical protein
MPQLKLTAEIHSAAFEGFEGQKKRIDAWIAEIKQSLGGGAASKAPKLRPQRPNGELAPTAVAEWRKRNRLR